MAPSRCRQSQLTNLQASIGWVPKPFSRSPAMASISSPVPGPSRRQEDISGKPQPAFLKVVPAKIGFTLDAAGKVTGAVLQGGRTIPLPRIDEGPGRRPSQRCPRAILARTWPVMATGAPRFLTNGADGGLDYWPCSRLTARRCCSSRSMDKGRTWSLWKIAASGGTARSFVTLPVTAARAAWSAALNLIAFTGTDADRKSNLWTIKGDGSGACRCMRRRGNELIYPSWFPDARTLATMDGSALVAQTVAGWRHGHRRSPVAPM